MPYAAGESDLAVARLRPKVRRRVISWEPGGKVAVIDD